MTEGSVILWQRSRWITLSYLVGLFVLGGACAAILANGALATSRFSHGAALFIGGFGFAAAGLGAVVGVLELINPTRLIVRSEGFEQRGLWRQSLVTWSEVAGFVVWRQQTFHAALTHSGYRLTEEARAKRKYKWHRLMAFGRYDGWLMSEMGEKPREIVSILERYHQMAKERDGPRLSLG